MYITFSSTGRGERKEGKIHKYYIECKNYKQARNVFIKAKFAGSKTHYVSMRFSQPKYAEQTHRIVDSYTGVTEFKKKYKGD